MSPLLVTWAPNMITEDGKQNFEYWNREYHAPNVESFIFRLKPYLLDKHFPTKKKLKQKVK